MLQNFIGLLKKLLSDYLLYSKYLLQFLSPLYLCYGLSSFLRQTITGNDYDRLEKLCVGESKKLESLIKGYELLMNSYQKQQNTLNILVTELDRLKDTWNPPTLPVIDWLGWSEKIHDNPSFYVPAAVVAVSVYIVWPLVPLIWKYIKTEQLKKEIVKQELLKKELESKISSNPNDKGPIATSSDTNVVSNEEQFNSFDNISFFDFF